MKLFLFEWKKIASPKKFKWALLLFCIVVIALFARNYFLQDYAQEQIVTEIDFYIETSEIKHRMYEHLLEANDSEDLLLAKELNLAILSSAREWRGNIVTPDWKQSLTYQNQFLEHVKIFLDVGEDYPLDGQYLEERLFLNETLLQSEIPYEFEAYSIAVPNFLKQVVDICILYGSIIFILLLVGEILTREFEQKSINLLFTQPLNRLSVIGVKYVSSFLTYVLVVTLLITTSIIISTIFGTAGSFEYPIVIEKDGAYMAITTMDYLIKGLLLSVVFIIFVITLLLLYSLIFKHTLTTLFVLLSTVGGGYVMMGLFQPSVVSWVNPFRYLLIQEAILNQNQQQWYESILATLLLALILFVITLKKANQTLEH